MTEERKVAIVTGSSQGLGAAVAQQLAAKGWNVVVNYSRSAEPAEAVADACRDAGADVMVVKANVADDADCRRLAAETIAKWGRIDALVNNAGTTRFAAHSDMEALSAEDFQAVYAVNVIGPYQMIRAVKEHMKERGAGAVVNISSIAGVLGIGSSVAYVASKGALNMMTKSLARVLGPEIRINAVCPGLIQTQWLRAGLGDEAYEALVDQVLESTPLKAASMPEDIAEVVVWLVEGARHVTGETVMVDAGTHLTVGLTVKR